MEIKGWLSWVFVSGCVADLSTTLVGGVFGHGREAMALSHYTIGMVLVLSCCAKLFVLWWATSWSRWCPALAPILSVGIALSAFAYWVASVNNVRTI